MLTINGKAEMVVQDAASYQRLMQLVEQAEMIEFLAKAGRTSTRAERSLRLKRWSNLPGSTSSSQKELDRCPTWCTSRKAVGDIDDAMAWRVATLYPPLIRWYLEIMEVIRALADDAEQWGEWPESEWYPGILERLVGKKRSIYRILFEIRGDTVYILRVRYGGQNLLGPSKTFSCGFRHGKFPSQPLAAPHADPRRPDCARRRHLPYRAAGADICD